MRVRPLEIKALIPLLEQDWPDEENEAGEVIQPGIEMLAEALIRALDEVRASRTSYVWVAQFGPPKMGGMTWYAGAGPYAGRKSAERAVKGWPGAELASVLAVVPILTSEGLQRQIEKTDKPRETA